MFYVVHSACTGAPEVRAVPVRAGAFPERRGGAAGPAERAAPDEGAGLALAILDPGRHGARSRLQLLLKSAGTTAFTILAVPHLAVALYL